MKKKLQKFAIIAAIITAILYLINKFIYLIATMEDLLSKTKGETYNWRFGEVHYKKKGNGKPVLLIHDLNVFSSMYEWDEICDNLAETNTVYMLDLLGCGQSDKPFMTYTNYLYVQLVNDFIKNIIQDKTDVIVTGTSSSFILMANQIDNTIIDKIIMVNPDDILTMAKNPTLKTKILRYFLCIPVFGTIVYNTYATKGNIDSIFNMEYFYNTHNVKDEYIKKCCEAAHVGNLGPKFLFASMKGRLLNTNITEALKSTNNSTYIIVGTGNPEEVEIANKYQELTPAIEILPIEKTKHLPQLENPDAFVENIKIALES